MIAVTCTCPKISSVVFSVVHTPDPLIVCANHLALKRIIDKGRLLPCPAPQCSRGLTWRTLQSRAGFEFQCVCATSDTDTCQYSLKKCSSRATRVTAAAKALRPGARRRRVRRRASKSCAAIISPFLLFPPLFRPACSSRGSNISSFVRRCFHRNLPLLNRLAASAGRSLQFFSLCQPFLIYMYIYLTCGGTDGTVANGSKC